MTPWSLAAKLAIMTDGRGGRTRRRCGFGHSRPRRFLGFYLALPSLWLACGGKSETTGAPPALVDVPVNGDACSLFASGTRLKAHYLDGGGGACKLLWFYDSLLDIECKFVETALGQYRCLPLRYTSSFSDAGCTAATLPIVGACSDEPALARGDLITATSADCSAMVGAYSLDTEQTAESPYYLSGGSVCFEPSVSAAPELQWTARAEPITRFVRATAAVIGAAGGLQAWRITAEDGAFTTKDLLVDSASCSPIGVDGVTRCVPGTSSTRFQPNVGDTTCPQPMNVAQASLTTREQCAGERPRYLFEATGDGCSRSGTIFALGERLSSFTAQGACAASAPVPDRNVPLYRIGAPVAGSDFQEVRSAQVGSGALTISCFMDSAGTPIGIQSEITGRADWSLDRGLPCQLFVDENGAKRCVPAAQAMDNTKNFADERCSEPIYALELYCERRAISYLLEGVVGPCPFSARVNDPSFTHAYVAAAYSGPVYATFSGDCQAYPDPHPGVVFYTTGQEVRPEEFPLVRETSDL